MNFTVNTEVVPHMTCLAPTPVSIQATIFKQNDRGDTITFNKSLGPHDVFASGVEVRFQSTDFGTPPITSVNHLPSPTQK
jgi:hypothetical protein